VVLRVDDVIKEERPQLLAKNEVKVPEKDEFSHFIPIYINEPFSLALMATFAVIIQQGNNLLFILIEFIRLDRSFVSRRARKMRES